MNFSIDQAEKGRGYWQVPTNLLSDPVFVKRMENIIDSTIVENPNMKAGSLWDLTKFAIKKDSIKYMGECYRRKVEWTAEIKQNIQKAVTARDQAHPNQQLVNSYTAKISYMQIERDQLVSTHHKQSRDFKLAWAHYESNRPTKYYYKLPGVKYDAIKSLKNASGIILEDSKAILKECHEYYNKLYTRKPHENAFDEDLQWKFLKNIPAIMNVEYAQKLDKNISQHEMYSALMKMKKDAAPGLDGLTVSFYIKFWDKVGGLVYRVAVTSFENGKLTPSQRRGVVQLIPKKARDLLEVRNWRPITLLNVDYKIISKLLALRLAEILPHLIGKDQKGFIRNCYIGDNIYELYSILSQVVQEQEDGILSQLDIEKAFNSVSLYYLQEVLSNFNFPASFMDWVTTLYKDKEIRIINNGHTSEVITPTNGLAQGDGLSPLLFILVIEMLALTIHQNDQIVGYKFQESHKKLALLADDLILSLKAHKTTVQAVFETLQEFSHISNLMVNTEKSIVFPIGPHRHKQEKACLVAPFTWSSNEHCEYLGIKVPITPQLSQHNTLIQS